MLNFGKDLTFASLLVVSSMGHSKGIKKSYNLEVCIRARLYEAWITLSSG